MGIRKYDWIEKYLEYEERSEPPILYKEWTAMSVIAGALQRKCRLPWGGPLVFYPNLYIVLVGPSGRCRKGTALRTGKMLLKDLRIRMVAEAITKEALIKDMASAGNVEVSFGDVSIIHSSLTVFSMELGVFLGYENKEFLVDLTDWYDCADDWEYKTKTSGIDEIIGVWLNLIGATTPKVIQNQFPESAVGGGLASRIIFVFEDKKSQEVAFPFLEEKHEDIYKWLQYELEEIHMMKGDFKIDETFIDKYGKWYYKQEVAESLKNERFSGYIERRPNHLLKMCMILSASSRDDMVITGEIFTRALDLLRRTEKKMARTFGGFGQAKTSGVSQRVIEFVAKEKEVSRSELYRKFYYDIENTKMLDEVITGLRVMGFADVYVNGTETMIKVKTKTGFEEYF